MKRLKKKFFLTTKDTKEYTKYTKKYFIYE